MTELEQLATEHLGPDARLFDLALFRLAALTYMSATECSPQAATDHVWNRGSYTRRIPELVSPLDLVMVAHLVAVGQNLKPVEQLDSTVDASQAEQAAEWIGEWLPPLGRRLAEEASAMDRPVSLGDIITTTLVVSHEYGITPHRIIREAREE